MTVQQPFHSMPGKGGGMDLQQFAKVTPLSIMFRLQSHSKEVDDIE